jgi:hypothetical protein
MKELSEMNINELSDYWTGQLIIAIGEGNFKAKVFSMLMCSPQFFDYQKNANINRPKEKE